jgi:hypothetical protein
MDVAAGERRPDPIQSNLCGRRADRPTHIEQVPACGQESGELFTLDPTDLALVRIDGEKGHSWVSDAELSDPSTGPIEDYERDAKPRRLLRQGAQQGLKNRIDEQGSRTNGLGLGETFLDLAHLLVGAIASAQNANRKTMSLRGDTADIPLLRLVVVVQRRQEDSHSDRLGHFGLTKGLYDRASEDFAVALYAQPFSTLRLVRPTF